MSNKTEVSTLVEEASYQPAYLRKTRNGAQALESDVDSVAHKYRVGVDALFHYFINDDDGSCVAANDDRDLSHGEAIAKLITRKFHSGIYLDNTVTRCEAPTWTKFRDEATFISGDIIGDAEHSIVSWLYYHHGDNMVVIDGSQYHEDSVKGSPVPAFNQLMDIANNQRRVIEEGVINLFPNDTRAAMQFLNAAQYEEIEGDAYGDTKWLAEGRILANALIDIPEFQQNFNLVVIKGVARYIHSDQINLNSLYRLFARLGRINTRFVFLG